MHTNYKITNSKSEATFDIYIICIMTLWLLITNFGIPWKPLAPIGSDESYKMATKRHNNREIHGGRETSKKELNNNIGTVKLLGCVGPRMVTSD